MSEILLLAMKNRINKIIYTETAEIPNFTQYAHF